MDRKSIEEYRQALVDSLHLPQGAEFAKTPPTDCLRGVPKANKKIMVRQMTAMAKIPYDTWFDRDKIKAALGECEMEESEWELRKIMEDLIYKVNDLIKDLNLLGIRLNEQLNEKEDE